MYYAGSNNTLIQGNFFENNSQTRQILIDDIGTNCQIKDNTFGSPNDYITKYSIELNSAPNVLIKNNTFWQGNFSAAWVSIYAIGNNNSGLKVQNNRWGNDTAFLNLSTGYALYVVNASHSIYENNSLYLQDGKGIIIRGSKNGRHKNMTIRNNTFDHDVTATSIPNRLSIAIGGDNILNNDGDLNDTIIENNTIRMASVHTSKHPLFTASNFNVTIRYNTVIGGGYGILSKHDTLYRAYNNTMENQTNFEGFVTRAGHNISVYNNTFLCPNYNRTESPYAIVAKNANEGPARNVTNFQSYNNRFYMHNQSYIYAFSENGTNFSNTNFTSHDNIIILNNSNQNMSWEVNSINRYNFTEFQKNYTLETNSIFSATREVPWVFNKSSNVSHTTGTINWTSQESANASIDYGTSLSFGTTYGNTSLGLFHSINISDLVRGTQYYYNITMCDYENNCNETGPYNFTTLVDAQDDSSDDSGGDSSPDYVGVDYYEPDAEEIENRLMWRDVKERDSINFIYRDESHRIEIRRFFYDKSKIVIFSEPKEVIVYFGRIKRVDLDLDGEDDIIVEATKQTISTFKISIREINIPVSTEYEGPEEEITGESIAPIIEEDYQEETSYGNLIIPILSLFAIIGIAGILLVLVSLKRKKKKSR